MDAEWVTYRDLILEQGAKVEGGFMTMKLAGPLGRAFRTLPAKMVVDPSWLANPLSIAAVNTALAVALLWAGGRWEPLR